MENNFSQISNNDRNQNSIPALPPQIVPGWESPEGQGSLKKFFRVLQRRYLIIGGVTIALMAGITYMTMKKIPVYEGNFRLLVEPVSDDSKLPNLTAEQEDNANNSVLDYESQIQVLTSPKVIDEAVKHLKTSFPDINYDSLKNSLIIQRVGDSKIINVSYRSQELQRIKTVLEKLADSYLKYSLEKRQTKLGNGIQFVEKQLPSIRKRVNQLEQQLQLFRQKYNFTDQQTESEQIKEQQNKLAEQRIAINQQLTKFRALLQNLQVEGENLVALSAQGNASTYEDLHKKLREAEIEIAKESAEDVHQKLREIDIEIAKESARFQEDSIPIEVLQEKRQNMISVLRQEEKRVKELRLEEAQRVKKLRNKEAKRLADLRRTEVDNEIKTLEQQNQALAQEERLIDAKLKELPRISREHSELQRELQVANESLNRFLGARESLEIKIAQTEVPWELVQAPVVPERPVSPNRSNDLILGLVASTLIAIGIALLLEKLDNSYHSVDELKENLSLPILVTIPHEKSLWKYPKHLQVAKISDGSLSDDTSQRLSTLLDRYSQCESAKFLEALRILHTNIQLLSQNEEIRSIVISSASFGEGKSTVAFHLARTAAAMGKRVLLVDANMRSPQIHQLSAMNNSWGLSNVISEGIPAQKVIPELTSVGELSILTAGSTPSDPANLLSSKEMEQLMSDFRELFDLVIYDSPPTTGLADASLLSYCCDGIVLVARIHKTDSLSLDQAIDNLRMSNIHILGIVANGTK